MKILKIVQDPKSGRVGIRINENEEYDIEEHLQLLMEFVSEEAIKTHELRNYYNEIIAQLGECKKKAE